MANVPEGLPAPANPSVEGTWGPGREPESVRKLAAEKHGKK